jgi:hypothetical protein
MSEIKLPPRLPQDIVDALSKYPIKLTPKMRRVLAELARNLENFGQSPTARAVREGLRRIQEIRDRERAEREVRDAKIREARRRRGGRPSKLSDKLAGEARAHLRQSFQRWGQHDALKCGLAEARKFLKANGNPSVEDSTVVKRIVNLVRAEKGLVRRRRPR